MRTRVTVNDYLTRLLTIKNKMKANDENKSDIEVVEKILCSMAQDTGSRLSVHEQRMTDTKEEYGLKATYGETSN